MAQNDDLVGDSINVTCTITTRGDIQISSQVLDQVNAHILKVSEQLAREGLIKLGWRPPLGVRDWQAIASKHSPETWPAAQDALALLDRVASNKSDDPPEDAWKALVVLQREFEYATSRISAQRVALSLCRADLEKARHDRDRYRARIELLQADGGAAAMGKRRPPG